jgi:hypothetical protein
VAWETKSVHVLFNEWPTARNDLRHREHSSDVLFGHFPERTVSGRRRLDPSLALRMTMEALRMTMEALRMTMEALRMTTGTSG